MFDEDSVAVWVSRRCRNEFLDLMATVCCDVGLDEVLPDVPEHLEDLRYVMLRRPKHTDCRSCLGDVVSGFDHPSPHRDVLVRRLPKRQYEPLYRLRPLPQTPREHRALHCLKRRHHGISARTVGRYHPVREPKWYTDRELMEPHGLPNSEEFLQGAREALLAAARNGSSIDVYLDGSMEMVSAAISIQSAFRAYRIRRRIDYCSILLQFRAAIYIQRSWRQFLFKGRLECLSGMKSIVNSMAGEGHLTPLMCMDVRGDVILREAERNPMPPSERIHFAIDDEDRVIIVAPNDSIRPGLPKWLGVDIPIVYESDLGEASLAIGVTDAKDAGRLITHKTDIRVLYDYATNQKSSSLTEEMSEDVYMLVMFSSIEEAKRRAVLLMTLTWKSLIRAGAKMLPVACTELGKSLIAVSKLTLSRSPSDILKVEIFQAAREMLPFDSPLLPYVGQMLLNCDSKREMKMMIRATWASRYVKVDRPHHRVFSVERLWAKGKAPALVYQQGTEENMYFSDQNEEILNVNIPCGRIDDSTMTDIEDGGSKTGNLISDSSECVSESPKMCELPINFSVSLQASITKVETYDFHLKIRQGKLTAIEENIKKVELVKNPPKQYIPQRSANTGHLFNPDYDDLQICDYGFKMEAMRVAYRENAAKKVDSARARHRDVMSSIRDIQKNTAENAAWKGGKQLQVVLEVVERNRCMEHGAKRARVERRHARVQKQREKIATRQHFEALNTHITSLSRNVLHAEITHKRIQCWEETNQLVEERRQEFYLTQDSIQAQLQDIVRQKENAAKLVRSQGYTSSVRAHYDAKQKALHSSTKSRQNAEKQRQSRLGPAGGVWGCKSRESLKEILPMGTVMKANSTPKSPSLPRCPSRTSSVEGSQARRNSKTPSFDGLASPPASARKKQKAKSEPGEGSCDDSSDDGMDGLQTLSYSNMLSSGGFKTTLPPLKMPGIERARMRV
ncbi:hypothetical protein BSKO_13708 [Bryopsis sp. KO-2023]|nr:hypothetical protein BSKO_13708 [Bryopsis sp. KO-2023]